MKTHLERMINAQPDVLDTLADIDVTAATDVISGAHRIWLVGTGTSLHAAELGAIALQGLDIDARWVAAAHLTHHANQLRPGDAAVVITHTGQTAYAIRSRQEILAAGVPLVCITGPNSIWPNAITTPLAERSETYTASYTAALAVLARVTHELGAPDADADALHATAAHVRTILDEPGVDHIAMPARAMAIIGAGAWSITAREGALKIREAARILCEGFDPERLLHGAAVPYTAADTLLVLQPEADTDGLVTALADAARAERVPVMTISDETPAVSPLLAQIPMTVQLQLLALRFAAQRGQDPDVAIVGAWAETPLWELGSARTHRVAAP